MADTLADLNVKIGADIDDFEAGMARVQEGIGRLGDGLKNVGQGLSTYVSLPLTLLGGAAVAAAAKIDSLSRGLQAVTQQQLGQQGVTGLDAVSQSAASTQKQLADLREVAKLPGLGFSEAVAGSVRLQAVGISADQARKVLLAFGNAIATTGGGKSELDRVTVQLGQLSAKGKVLSQDLRPIIEAAPAVATALKNLYGTVDSETISASLAKQGKSSADFIEVLTTELGKLPKVTGGLKNAFENLGDTAELNLARLGDSINKSFNLEGLADKIAEAITSITDSFTNLDPTTQAVILSFLGVVAAAGPVLVAVGALGAAIPPIIAGFAALGTATETIGLAFAAATGPIGLAVAALAALAGGIYYAATAADRSLQAYQEQARQADSLTASINPLLARYNELSTKTVLTNAEQAELASVIQQIANLVPSATTAIDAYGKATGISAAAVTEYTAALQAQKAAQAALNLPAAAAKLDELGTKYRVLKEQADEFNRTGAIKVAVFDEGGGSLETYKAGSQAVLQLQANLATANVEFIKQKQVVDDLRGSTTALVEADASLLDTLNSVGLAGAAAGGILIGLREQLKKLKDERENADTEKETLAYNPLIKAIEAEIARLEGVDKASKKATDAVAKLRLELSRLTALDKLLGDTPDQINVLQRRADALTTGLKTLVDAGVSTSSRAFQGFALDLVRTSQALDKLRAGSGTLDLKPVNVKSLIPQTIGDTLAPDVARLLGDYAKTIKPFELPVPVKLNIQAIAESLQPVKLTDTIAVSKNLYKELLNLGAGFDTIKTNAALFGGSFDAAGARADVLRGTIQNLISQGFSPQSTELQNLASQLRTYTIESQNAQLMSESLRTSAANLGAALGDALGKVAFAGGGLEDVFKSVFASLIDALADFAEKKGKLLIALGIADLATPGLQGIGAAELAGGIGLIAAAGIARAGATALTSPSGGGSISAPSSAGYNSTANTGQIKVQVEVTGQLGLRGKELVAALRTTDYRALRTN